MRKFLIACVLLFSSLVLASSRPAQIVSSPPVVNNPESVIVMAYLSGGGCLLSGSCSTPHFILANAHTLTRIYANVNVQGVTCAQLAQIGIYDNTSSTVLSYISIPNSTNDVDSGALSVSMIAGHRFALRNTQIASGCGTTPQYVFSATYQ